MKKRLLLTAVLLAVAWLAIPMPASAADIFQDACKNGKTAKSAVCSSTTSTDPVSGDNGALAHIIDIITYVAGAAAIIIIVYGAIKYITSGGDAANVKNAKDTVFYALIGLAVIVLAKALMLFVLGKL